ncbi:MAG: AAA family ATPase [Gammaproteobacteria bacterium]|nr:AAA family ATPase [Gammaproteobacteria bacterium]
MYETFYGFREKPFSLLPDPGYLYLSQQHQMALTLLDYSLENQAGFCVITGSIGTGKTTLIRRLLGQTGKDISVGLISNTHHSFGELLRWIMVSFGLETSEESRPKLYQLFMDFLISQYAKNKRTMIIIDEAQNMSVSALEELRMLSNINSEKDLLLQIVLIGQPGLREILSRPDLEQFAQRIVVDYHLEPLQHQETHEYIRHRLKTAGGEEGIFSDDGCDAVYRHSGGTPRLINLLCDMALVYGYAGQAAVITESLITQVIRERQANGSLQVFDKNADLKPKRVAAAAPAPAKNSVADALTASVKSKAHSFSDYIRAGMDKMSKPQTETAYQAQRTMPDIRAYEMAVAGHQASSAALRDPELNTVASSAPASSPTPAIPVLGMAEAVTPNELSQALNSEVFNSAPPAPAEQPLASPSAVPETLALENVAELENKNNNTAQHTTASVTTTNSVAVPAGVSAPLAVKTDETPLRPKSKSISIIKVDWSATQTSVKPASVARKFLPYGVAALVLIVIAVGTTFFFISSNSKNAVAKSIPLTDAKVITPVPVTTVELPGAAQDKNPAPDKKLEHALPPAMPSQQAVVNKKDPIEELRKKIIENQRATLRVTPKPASPDSKEELRLKILENQRDAALAMAKALERERQAALNAAEAGEQALTAAKTKQPAKTTDVIFEQQADGTIISRPNDVSQSESSAPAARP